MTAEYKLDAPPMADDRADGLVKELVDGTREKLGFVPNMYRGMAINPGFLSSFVHGYDHVRTQANFTPPEQNVVFLMVSLASGCEYCTGAHSILAINLEAFRREDTGAERRQGAGRSEARGVAPVHPPHVTDPQSANAGQGVQDRRLHRSAYTRDHPGARGQDHQHLCQSREPHPGG